MTKKDFIALADSLRHLDVPPDVLKALVAFCYDQNPNFNEGRWLSYLYGECGPNGGVPTSPKGRSRDGGKS